MTGQELLAGKVSPHLVSIIEKSGKTMKSCTFFLGWANHKLLLSILSGLLFVFSQNAFSHRIICPNCDKETEISEEDLKSEVTHKCSHCINPAVYIPIIRSPSEASNIILSFPGVLPIQPASAGSVVTVRNIPIARPAVPSATATIASGLDTSLELANILRPADNDRNLVFSPAAMTSLLTLLSVSANLRNNSNLASQTARARSPESELALSGSGTSGYRDQSWFLARDGRRFSRHFHTSQFNPDIQNSIFGSLGPNAPDRINEQIREFVQSIFSESTDPALTAPRLQFSEAAQVTAITVATFIQNWRDPFIRGTMDFTTRNGQTIEVSSMSSAEPVRVRYGRDESGWQIIILPYANGGDRMILLVPPGPGMPSPASYLSSERIRQLVGSATNMHITLTMPNFSTNDEHNFHTALRGSSLQWMISSASFSANLTNPPINVATVESRQFITFESDERGSRAVAVTQTEINEAYVQARHDIRIDRPYTALVVNFEGRVCFHLEINNPNNH